MCVDQCYDAAPRPNILVVELGATPTRGKWVNDTVSYSYTGLLSLPARFANRIHVGMSPDLNSDTCTCFFFCQRNEDTAAPTTTGHQSDARHLL